MWRETTHIHIFPLYFPRLILCDQPPAPARDALHLRLINPPVYKRHPFLCLSVKSPSLVLSFSLPFRSDLSSFFLYQRISFTFSLLETLTCESFSLSLYINLHRVHVSFPSFEQRLCEGGISFPASVPSMKRWELFFKCHRECDELPRACIKFFIPSWALTDDCQTWRYLCLMCWAKLVLAALMDGCGSVFIYLYPNAAAFS